MKTISIVLLLAAVVLGREIPQREGDIQRIVGGSVTTINQYPFAVALLRSPTSNYYTQACGGTIINNRNILTAAHCFNDSPLARQWRSRVGSTYANSGGTVHVTQQIIIHPYYNYYSNDNDFAIIRVSGAINYIPNVVAKADIAGERYTLRDNEVVWAVGWGTIYHNGPPSEQLRHVQVWTVNQAECARRYASLGNQVTTNMLCSGWLNVGGRDQCQGDSGGPLIHNRVVVGVCSWGADCANQHYPGVNARVSTASRWITANAN